MYNTSNGIPNECTPNDIWKYISLKLLFSLVRLPQISGI